MNVNPETGEIIQEFVIDSTERLEWYLEKRSEKQSEIDRLNQRLSDYTENIKALIRSEESDIDHLDFKFKLQAQEFVSEQLGDGKSRSIRTPFGVAGFRKKQGSVTVSLQPEAVKWARENGIDCVKTVESVLVSKIPEGTELPSFIFEVKHPSDEFYIKEK